MTAEFYTEHYANQFARKAAEETGKAARVRYNKYEEKYVVIYESEARDGQA